MGKPTAEGGLSGSASDLQQVKERVCGNPFLPITRLGKKGYHTTAADYAAREGKED